MNTYKFLYELHLTVSMQVILYADIGTYIYISLSTFWHDKVQSELQNWSENLLGFIAIQD